MHELFDSVLFHTALIMFLQPSVHTARVPLLRRLFPDAKFIYIHRHPYEVLQSAVNMADTAYWYCYLNTPTDEQIVEFILWQFEHLFKKYNRAVTDGQPVDQSEEALASLNTEHLKKRVISTDTLEISYHDLISEPLRVVQSIYEHSHH